MSDLFTEIEMSRSRRSTGNASNLVIDANGGRFESPPEKLQEFGISLPEDQYATNTPPRTEALSEEEMQAYRDAAKAKGLDFDGFIMPQEKTGRERANEWLTNKLMSAGKALGLDFDRYEVQSITNDIFGNPAAANFSDQIGLVDFLGVGAYYGAEEGYKTMSAGMRSAKKEMEKPDGPPIAGDDVTVRGVKVNDLAKAGDVVKAGVDVPIGAAETALNIATSYPGVRTGYNLAKSAGRKILEAARQRKANRSGGTTLRTGITGEDVDDAIVAMGDMFTPQVDQDELGFFSKALEEIKNLKQEKGQGSQFKAMLLNAGVKPDELKWTGLDDLLSKKNVTKEELMEHAKNNRVQIKETVLEGPDENTPASLNFDGGEVLDDYEEYAHEVDYILDEVIGNVAARGFINEERLIFVEKIDSGLKEKPGYNPAMLEALKKGEFEYTDADGNVVDFQFNVNEIAEELGRERYLENPQMRYSDPDSGYDIDGNDDYGYSITTPNGERLGGDIYSLDEAKVQAETHAMDYGFIQYEGDARFLDNTQDGGENYREILLQNDNFSGDPEYANVGVQIDKLRQQEFQLRQEQGALAFDPVRNSEKIQAIEKQLGELRKQESEIRTKLPKFSLNFRENAHFAEDNIIAHVRVKDREDINGNKVLYIEEFQSDWAQAGGGRKSDRMRFNSPEIQANKAKISSLQAKSKELLQAFNEKVKNETRFGITNFNAPITNFKMIRKQMDPAEAARKIDKKVPGVLNMYNELQNIFKESENLSDTVPNTIVPRGPLVEKTDQWTQMGLKRMIRYATENGYDYVAWSPGDVQVARWNEPGLKQFYDSILPKNSNAVLKKLDKKAKVEVIELPMIDRKSWPERDGKQKTLAIPITDNIRSSAPKGQPLFTPIAATALGGGLAAQSMNQERQ